MQTQAQTHTPDSRQNLTLEALAAMPAEELGALYAEAPAPTSLQGLDGHPRGRMLAVRAAGQRPAFQALRRLAQAPWFPWGGKSFRPTTDTAGKGVNRVRLLGRHALFPFETSIVPSAIDGRDCVFLQYDLPDNPWLIRQIHDEVREVSPGLWLGPAMWKGEKGPTFLLWFALDVRDQARELVFA